MKSNSIFDVFTLGSLQLLHILTYLLYSIIFRINLLSQQFLYLQMLFFDLVLQTHEFNVMLETGRFYFLTLGFLNLQLFNFKVIVLLLQLIVGILQKVDLALIRISIFDQSGPFRFPNFDVFLIIC
jgi:hypothetical protein